MAWIVNHVVNQMGQKVTTLTFLDISSAKLLVGKTNELQGSEARLKWHVTLDHKGSI